MEKVEKESEEEESENEEKPQAKYYDDEGNFQWNEESSSE